MSKGFLIDETKCTGCKACVINCKDKNGLDAGMNLRTVEIEESGTFPKVSVCFHSKSCHNCQEPTCMKECPSGAIYRDKELGIVLVNEEKCIGCGTCMKACPFGAPVVDPETKKCKKCNFCYDLLRKGEKPACVDVCNARCLDFGEIDELKEKYKDAKLLEGKTKPNTLVISK